MLKRVLWIGYFVLSFGVCYYIWGWVTPTLGPLGKTVHEGGPLVALLIFLCILVINP